MIAEETDVEILPPETFEADGESLTETKAKKRFGPIALIATAFASSLFGAGIMLGANNFMAAPILDIAPTEAKLVLLTDETQNLNAEAKTLKAQIARLQRDIKAKAPAAPAVDLLPLEARLSALENAEPAQIDEEMVARLEALQSDGSEALDLTDILTRLAALENRPVASDDILSRLRVLESQPATIAAVPVVTAERLKAMPAFPAFPEDKIRAAIVRAEPSTGWLKKSLKKHISVQSDENPTYLLETILKHLEAGEIKSALAAFDKLPAEVKSAGQYWRETIESSE